MVSQFLERPRGIHDGVKFACGTALTARMEFSAVSAAGSCRQAFARAAATPTILTSVLAAYIQPTREPHRFQSAPGCPRPWPRIGRFCSEFFDGPPKFSPDANAYIYRKDYCITCNDHKT
jgi:hypothetical protein